jgi:hypothetical protein
MNKKIIPAVLLIVVIVTAGYLVYLSMGNKNSQTKEMTPEAKKLSELKTGCENTGGVVLSAMCCGSTDNFPNLCLIGACGCSPESSHEVKICDCGPDKCFDGTVCK